MESTDLALEGVKLLKATVHSDYRGWYTETYATRTMAQWGIDTVFVQDNHSFSRVKGTLRGIHFQNSPKAQVKLVRCLRGSLFDIVVDLRKGSPTYKQWIKVQLDEHDHQQLFIPAGFGHGFVTLTDQVEFFYKVSELYAPEYDRAIRWDDPELGIDWGVTNPIVSDKDRNAPTLANSDVNFVYGK